MDFPTHTTETAPDRSKEILEAARNGYGFVPNLLAVMAESPALLKGYRLLSKVFEETSLSPVERQIVLLIVSRENDCEYCVAAHTATARRQAIDNDIIEAVRNGFAIDTPRLNALAIFTAHVVNSRGWPTEAALQGFLDAGFEMRHVLDILLGVGLKTLSNYTNHVAKTKLDPAFAKAAWSKAA